MRNKQMVSGGLDCYVLLPFHVGNCSLLAIVYKGEEWLPP